MARASTAFGRTVLPDFLTSDDHDPFSMHIKDAFDFGLIFFLDCFAFRGATSASGVSI